MPTILDRPEYNRAQIMERLTEPDRVLIFRVSWEDDEGNVRVNRAWRVQFNNSIGPYKGGLRFSSDVTLSVLKFLAFEQVFKNSLTGLPMGGAKGGSNFNPKGKSDREIMRFCQSLMIELHRHIGEDTDVPAGDIGVGAREIGYLFGQYLRLANRFTGILTGKGLAFGGSLIRTEATGHGCMYFTEEMLAARGDGLEEKTAIVSGSGNVALYTIEKLCEMGARVVTASDSGGFIHDPDGIRDEKLIWLRDLKEKNGGRIHEYAERWGCDYHEAEKPWNVPADLASLRPHRTRSPVTTPRPWLTMVSSLSLKERICPATWTRYTCSGSRKSCMDRPKQPTPEELAVSGLEQSQNSLRNSWSKDEVDRRFRTIMSDIHGRCVSYRTRGDGYVDYVDGANIAAFTKVAEAMMAYGIV